MADIFKKEYLVSKRKIDLSNKQSFVPLLKYKQTMMALEKKAILPLGASAPIKNTTLKDKKEIVTECIKMVRDKVGPVAAFKLAVVVKRLPKTRSGKILRGTVRKIADNEPYKMPATIDDPVILDEIKADLIENKILKL